MKKKYEDVELPLEQAKLCPSPQFEQEGKVIIDLLKLIHERLKAIERHTFPGH